MIVSCSELHHLNNRRGCCTSRYGSRCCSVLQRVAACVAVRCSVLHHLNNRSKCCTSRYGSRCCSVLQRVAARGSVLQYVAVCCITSTTGVSAAPVDIAAGVALCCSAWQRVAVHCSVLHHLNNRSGCCTRRYSRGGCSASRGC